MTQSLKTVPTSWPWQKAVGLARLMQIVKDAGGEVRVVGGAVRDALLGRVSGEVDLATTLPPERMIEILQAAGLKVVPTGLAHGTITAVIDHVGYEITTLRHDVETDGRHAKVEFTDDWKADAARRDFTINAMYVDAAGTLYDYFSGQEDLAARRVRFIGDATARITEDVLRILRFFRFTAVFAQASPDTDALDACRGLANKIPSLSVERVWREVVKLLAAPNPVPAWRLMQDAGVLNYVLPDATNIARLEKLLGLEKICDVEPAPLTRLAALLQDDVKTIKLCVRLKLSKREMVTLTKLIEILPVMRKIADPVPLRRAIYEHGTEACAAALLIVGAEDEARVTTQLYDQAMTWEVPSFPVQGEDIVNLGVPPGPRVGQILQAVETWWKDDDFRPTRNECLAHAKAL